MSGLTDTQLMLAKAVCEGVLKALFAAQNDPDNEVKWRKHADKLEAKYIAAYGEHPYTTIEREGRK